MTPQMISFIEGMKHSPAHNYVIPGLTSWLIGTPSAHGCVRMFTMSRTHEEPIVPHTHRFDFQCLVLRGAVHNHIWTSSTPTFGDFYEESIVKYKGTLGEHEKTTAGRDWFERTVVTYTAGQEYGMKAEEFHSIYFERGTSVLFFEGPNRLDYSQVLEPVVDGKVIPIFKTEKWMFKGAAS